MFDDKRVLITGGTGSFGKAFIRYVKAHYQPERLIVYSRDELKQFEIEQEFGNDQMRYFIGDVRDAPRLSQACEEVDIIIHAAALKQVPVAEYNPFEAIKTNIIGAENVVQAAICNNVKKVVALSTDKASAPINLYGATKLCSDKLFLAANNIRGKRKLSFSVVRYGNVIGSRGSVIPFFLSKQKESFLPVTDERMTRFNISLLDGIKLVLFAVEKSFGGELYVPKIPSYRILDVVEAIAPNAGTKIIGIRPGEKLHEEMITEHDALNAIDAGDKFVIAADEPQKNFFKKVYANAEDLPTGFSYNSKDNPHFLNVDEIRKEIQLHVDPNFRVGSD